jgi:hypothetical protein
MLTLQIDPFGGGGETGTSERKSRQFAVEVIGLVAWSRLGSEQKEGVLRPLFLALQGPRSAMETFILNLVSFKLPASISGMGAGWPLPTAVECPNELGYIVASDTQGEWQTAQLYLPVIASAYQRTELSGEVEFCTLIPDAWVKERVHDEIKADPPVVEMARQAYKVWQDEPAMPRLELSDDAVLELVPAATQFAQILDLTTNCPIPATADDDDTPAYGLYLYLYLASMAAGIAVLPQPYPDRRATPGKPDPWQAARRERDFVVVGEDALGLAQAVAVAQPRARVEEFIASTTRRYLELAAPD